MHSLLEANPHTQDMCVCPLPLPASPHHHSLLRKVGSRPAGGETLESRLPGLCGAKRSTTKTNKRHIAEHLHTSLQTYSHTCLHPGLVPEWDVRPAQRPHSHCSPQCRNVSKSDRGACCLNPFQSIDEGAQALVAYSKIACVYVCEWRGGWEGSLCARARIGVSVLADYTHPDMCTGRTWVCQLPLGADAGIGTARTTTRIKSKRIM